MGGVKRFVSGSGIIRAVLDRLTKRIVPTSERMLTAIAGDKEWKENVQFRSVSLHSQPSYFPASAAATSKRRASGLREGGYSARRWPSVSLPSFYNPSVVKVFVCSSFVETLGRTTREKRSKEEPSDSHAS